MRPGVSQAPCEACVGMAATGEAPCGHARSPRGLHTVHAVFDNEAGFRPGADLLCGQQEQVRRRLPVCDEI
jgi:hypothetical protein